MLVQIHFAPLNPSDLACLKGGYDEAGVFKFDYPIVQGNEASGIVVKSGGGMMANRLVGSKVACVRTINGYHYQVGGMYQQYAIAEAMTCFTLDKDADLA